MLTHSFEGLSQTFRVMTESYGSFNRLLIVDRMEALGTLEIAINSKLNAFANLYDLMRANLGNPIDWYDTPELCSILAIRNARHHNTANSIRSIYDFHIQNSLNPEDTKKYLYVNFPSGDAEDQGNFMDVPISWKDIDTLLSLPRGQSRLKPIVKDTIRNYLNADYFEQKAIDEGLTKDDIFINFIPLTLNAGIILAPYIKSHITTNSVEAEFFLDFFETMDAPNTTQHEYKIQEFSLPAVLPPA